MTAVYLDSSALVKLVVPEPETDALVAYLSDRPQRFSCALVRVEVLRAVWRHGTPATRRARQLVDRLALLRLDDVLLDAAADLGGGGILRSLDAIHLAAARTLGPEPAELVTYDLRMADAARGLGLVATAPAG
jgi:uncharacterized protein